MMYEFEDIILSTKPSIKHDNSYEPRLQNLDICCRYIEFDLECKEREKQSNEQ